MSAATITHSTGHACANVCDENKRLNSAVCASSVITVKKENIGLVAYGPEPPETIDNTAFEDASVITWNYRSAHVGAGVHNDVELSTAGKSGTVRNGQILKSTPLWNRFFAMSQTLEISNECAVLCNNGKLLCQLLYGTCSKTTYSYRKHRRRHGVHREFKLFDRAQRGF